MDLFDILRDGHIHERIDYVRRESDVTGDAVFRLEAKVRALETANRALWSLLKDRVGVTDEELERALLQAREIPPRQIGEVPEHCPSCGRKLLSQTSPACSWCGVSLATPAMDVEDAGRVKAE